MTREFAFWACLFFPGYAVLRALDPAVLRDGPLAVIGRSYIASFVLLTPISVMCYALHLPMALFATAIVVAVSSALLVLLQANPPWRYRLTRLACLTWLRGMTAAGTVAGLIVIADIVLGSRVGSHTGGDAGFHVGRARMLIDHGFNNWDPVIAGHIFEPLYHSNLYHALLAACAVLSGTHAGVAWLSAWPFAKLLQAAGIKIQ